MTSQIIISDSDQPNKCLVTVYYGKIRLSQDTYFTSDCLFFIGIKEKTLKETFGVVAEIIVDTK